MKKYLVTTHSRWITILRDEIIIEVEDDDDRTPEDIAKEDIYEKHNYDYDNCEEIYVVDCEKIN